MRSILSLFSIAVALIVTTSTPTVDALWGGTGSDVTDFMLHKELAKVEKSKHLWVIALYRDGCGYCELLKPEWEKVAQKMRKQIGIAAVDVVTHQHIAKALQEKYKFEVKGVPTVIILKPKPNGKKALVVYEGERKVKAMVKAFGNHMPEFVATISDDSYDAWESKPGAKAVLFSKKKEVPTILKALSTKYQGRMHFGIIDPSSIVLKARFLVSEYPQLLIVEDGRAVGKKDYIPIPYKGKSKFFSMDSFLLDFAGEKPSDDEPDSSNTTSESSKTQKAKSDSPTTSSPTSASTKDSEGKKKADKKKTTEKSKSKSKPAEKKSKKDEQDDASSETEEEKIVRKEKEKKIRKEKREKSKADAKKAAQKRKEKEAKKSKKKPKSGLRTLPQPANPIVLKGTDLKTLSVKELRGILARWDDPCNACTEKDQFLMKIADNRKEYGDMEAIAKMYAKKPSQRKRTAAHPDVGTGAKDSGGDGGNGEDDLLCGRMLKMETGPLLDQIQALTLENEELKQLLANAQEPLVHGEL